MKEEKLIGNHILSYSYRINDMLLIICNDNSDERSLLFDKIGRTVHWVVEKMKNELKVDLLKEDVVVEYGDLKLLINVFIMAREKQSHHVELIEVEDLNNPSFKIVVDDNHLQDRSME